MEKAATKIGLMFDKEKFEDPSFGFEDPSFGFEDPSFGFEDPSFGYQTDELRRLLERMSGQQLQARGRVDGSSFELQVEGVKPPIRLQFESRGVLLWLREVTEKVSLFELQVNPEKLVAPRRDAQILYLAPAA